MPDQQSTIIDKVPSFGGRLVFTYFILILIFGSGLSFLLRDRLVIPLDEQRDELHTVYAQQVFDFVSGQLDQANEFSLAFNALAETNWDDEKRMRRLSEALLAKIPKDSAIVAAGIWPEPKALNARELKRSQYWSLRAEENGQQPIFHNDYNDPKRISYFGEIWYSPMRWHQGSRCHFTRQYTEPFLRRQVIACAYPIRINGKFVGVSSLVLAPEAWAQKSIGTKSFYLLLDLQQKIVSSSGLDQASGKNLAELGQTAPMFGPVAVFLHQAKEKRIQTVVDGQDNWSETLKEFIQTSRNLSEREAREILASVLEPPALSSAGTELEADNAQGQLTKLMLWQLPNGGHLIAGDSHSDKQLSGHSETELLSLALGSGSIALALLLGLIVSWRYSVGPLRHMLDQLKLPAEDTVLDVKLPGELSAISQYINLRHERIRKLLTQGVQNRASLTLATKSEGDAGVDDWSLLNALPEAVVLTEPDGQILHVNKAAAVLAGQTEQACLGANFDEVFHLSDKKGQSRLSQLPARAAKTGRSSERPMLTQYTSRSGQKKTISVSFGLLQDDSDAPKVLLMLHQERADQTGNVRSMPVQLKDSLTGLFNRQAFDQELESHCEANRIGGADKFHLLYADVDSINKINEQFGTEAGDELLAQLGRLIQSDVGENVPVYRVQGDKFGVILDTSDAAEAQVTAELLRADVQSWGFAWKGVEHPISISIGLLAVDKEIARAIDAQRGVSQLCQQAKADGGGKVVTGNASQIKVKEARDDRYWLANIKRGLSENLFHLSTQQVKSLQRDMDAAGQVFDSVLQLEDEEGFWNAKDVFMPVADRHNMSVQLDRWTFERIFEKLANDDELCNKMDFCIVSVSTSSMESTNFLDFLMEHFQGSGISRSKICIDLQESQVSRNLSTAKEFCQAISRAGCRVSISNVSTRPASYKLLKELPVQIVRFDPALTRRAHNDPVDRVVTESLHRICHTLNKKSMVEGVNSPELLRVLQGIGIDYAQGDAIARTTPMLFQAQA